MISFHNFALIVLFIVGFFLGFWSMRYNIREFFRWFRSRKDKAFK